jgi:2-polyprenyl-3-methyl-5-hydroxy-6-metoxy-1,4-benzoquinol methylase
LFSSIDAQEVSKFARASAEWWDPKGQFEMLHKMNPVRVRYIKSHILSSSPSSSLSPESLSLPLSSNLHTSNDETRRPFQNLNILDVGSGGGLLSEVRFFSIL